MTTSALLWHNHLLDLSLKPNSKTASWLQHPDKLSPLLKRCQQQLSVDLLQQIIMTPQIEECHFLHIAPHETALIREVFLQGDTERWCFARTIVPKPTYQAYQHQFDTLGTQLLGETIIYAGAYQRHPFEFAYITPDSWLANRLTHYHIDAGPLWARRSLFELSSQRLPLSLIEVFLPGVPLHSAG